jgi:hypothetical protein
MFDCVCVAVMCGVVAFVGWKGGAAERWMAVTIFVSWCIFTGLAWADVRPSEIGLGASDFVLTVGMVVCGHLEAERATRRWIGLIQLLAAMSMVFGGVACLLKAVGVGPVVFNFLVVNQLTSAAALAFLVLATIRRMKLDAEQRAKLNLELDLAWLPPRPLVIN